MKNFSEYIHIINKYSPKESVLITTIFILSGFCPIVTIIFVTDFINLAFYSAGMGTINSKIYFDVAAIILLYGYNLMLPAFQKLISEKAKINIRKKYKSILLEKCSKLEYYYLENAESWNLISRVLDKPENIIVGNYTAMNQIFATSISVIGLISIIIAQAWWAAIIIVVSCVPLFYLSIKSGKANYKAKIDSSELERKCEYYSEILSDRENVDERSIFGFTEMVNSEYRKIYNKAFKIKVSTRFKWFIKTKLGGVFTALAALIVIVALLNPLLAGSISMGMFISLVNAILSLKSNLSWGLSFQIDTITSGIEYMKDIKNFMSYEERLHALDTPVVQDKITSIEFKSVSFSYPGTDTQILKNVSFLLEGGKQYALVGPNGVGKTTIIKLLTGLYTNYDGEILINGKELRKYSFNEIKGFFSAVYQDFSRHEFTFKENIAIGNIEMMNTSYIDEAVDKAISQIELESLIENLPYGLNTNLGKIHKDGIDLSGGEWQRVALARAIISRSPVRILDEPTASLDPINENRIYELFSKISHDIMTILISHRLASTKIADEILVFNEGKLVEKGDFESLMNLKGHYCQMFEQQRSWYQ
ncbi:ABC transporter ATP-binding protein [Sedimentibacter hydroxybenzoicus DSM 7310]|uniref:ABC transporter ATP-binding protein n=1 Tax=Sedimentibacter hydroxybenzoicus DSM 7310 TaxID=1123245 RepID=A0A974BN60_SEDHY|nr:ABC transporter ATP-binding protein [Sedimentibacter hydroxybenzoicus]NYB75961.1 ABC transporter ATP-binding protein [Sedimentibacter hydroxybenzoicus DSM 7310]